MHGCFWHGHDCQHGRRQSRSNRTYWLVKIDRNRARDIKSVIKLGTMGWNVMTVWECELRDVEKIANELATFLGPSRTV